MRPALLVQASLVPDDAVIPWYVSLFDLEVIAKSTQFPAQLTSYLDERADIDPRAEWAGEDDLWMTHLLASLEFGHIAAPVFLVDGRTDLLTEQWVAGRPAPTASLPKAAKKALRRLSRARPPGWLAETEVLLADARDGRRPNVIVPASPSE